MGNSASGLTKEDLQFLTRKSSVSEKQIKEWHKGFMADAPEGLLDQQQFLTIFQALFPRSQSGSLFEHVFRCFDVDGSGRIDFKEFLQAISITQSGEPRDRLELAFRLYDMDSSGSIEQSELEEIIKAIYIMYDEDAEEEEEMAENASIKAENIFKKIDTNQDGYISQQEFIDGCTQDAVLFALLSSAKASTTAQPGTEPDT